MGKWIEVKAGEPFGILSVVSEGPRIGRQRKRQFVCLCECGNTITAQLTHLRTGHTVSCGCQRESRLGNENRTHGMTRTRTYRAWGDMKTRCTNPAANGYQHYGGRGIVVCARWLDSFEAFLEDMGEKPAGHRISVERLNNDGNYEPGNCVWATQKQQTRNKRNSRMITHDGRTQCLAAWSEETGIPKTTIWNRLNVGWSVQEALTPNPPPY